MGEGDCDGEVDRPRPPRSQPRVNATARIPIVWLIIAAAVAFQLPDGLGSLILTYALIALFVGKGAPTVFQLVLGRPNRPGSQAITPGDQTRLPTHLVELFDQMCLEAGFVPSREGRKERLADIRENYEDIAHLVAFLPVTGGPMPTEGSQEEQALTRVRAYLRRHVIMVKARDDAVANAVSGGGSDSGVPHVTQEDILRELNLLRGRNGHPG